MKFNDLIRVMRDLNATAEQIALKRVVFARPSKVSSRVERYVYRLGPNGWTGL
jgi:sarcosine oxidase gamma subunit